MSYQPDEFPDLKLSIDSDHIRGNYIADGGNSVNRSWKVLTELNFAKLWPEVLDSEDESMSLVFQLEGDDSHEYWGGESTGESSLDYFVGFKFDLSLGE